MIRKSDKITHDKNYVTVYHNFCTYNSKYECPTISNCVRLDIQLDIKEDITRYRVFNIILSSGANIASASGEIHFNVSHFSVDYRKVECISNTMINKNLYGYFINPYKLYKDEKGYIHSVIDIYFIAPPDLIYYNGTFISVYHNNSDCNIINNIKTTVLKQDDDRYYPLESGDIVDFDNSYITYSNMNNSITLYDNSPTPNERIYISRKYNRLMFRSQYSYDRISVDGIVNEILLTPLIYLDVTTSSNYNIYPISANFITKDKLDANNMETYSTISGIRCVTEYYLEYITFTRTQYVFRVVLTGNGLLQDNPLLICGSYRKKSSRFFDKIWDFLYKIYKITNILTTFPFLKYKIN